MLRHRFSRVPGLRRLAAAAAVVAAAGALAAPTTLSARDGGPAAVGAGPAAPANADDRAFLHQEGHVYLNAPLYTAPVQHVPIQVGGTMITNPAFAPHEMLYAHDYSAMYGPFYHRARGGWVVTPWGVRSNERWTLEGTRVNVKYRSKIPFFTGFTAPFARSETMFDNEWANTYDVGSPSTGRPSIFH